VTGLAVLVELIDGSRWWEPRPTGWRRSSCHSERPDVVPMELRMPMDGRRSHPGIPEALRDTQVLALTTYADD